MHKENRTFTGACDPYMRCARFCCMKQRTCTEKFIREHFNSSYFSQVIGREYDENFRILYGQPSCPLEQKGDLESVRKFRICEAHYRLIEYFV